MAETEIIAVATTVGTTLGSVLTYFATRRKVSSDDGATFRRDLIERVKHLEERLDTERHDCQEQLDVLRRDLIEEQRRCDEKLSSKAEELRAEFKDKLKRQAASIRDEYKRDLEEASHDK